MLWQAAHWGTLGCHWNHCLSSWLCCFLVHPLSTYDSRTLTSMWTQCCRGILCPTVHHQQQVLWCAFMRVSGSSHQWSSLRRFTDWCVNGMLAWTIPHTLFHKEQCPNRFPLNSCTLALISIFVGTDVTLLFTLGEQVSHIYAV